MALKYYEIALALNDTNDSSWQPVNSILDTHEIRSCGCGCISNRFVSCWPFNDDDTTIRSIRNFFKWQAYKTPLKMPTILSLSFMFLRTNHGRFETVPF